MECGWLADTCHCLTVGWGDPIRARSFNNTLFHQSWSRSRVKDGDKFCAWVKVITLKVSQLLARVCVHLLKIIWLTSTVPLAPSLISRPFCLSVIILLDFGGWQGCHLYILFRFQYINAILEYLGPFFSPKSNSTSLSYRGGTFCSRSDDVHLQIRFLVDGTVAGTLVAFSWPLAQQGKKIFNLAWFWKEFREEADLQNTLWWVWFQKFLGHRVYSCQTFQLWAPKVFLDHPSEGKITKKAIQKIRSLPDK